MRILAAIIIFACGTILVLPFFVKLRPTKSSANTCICNLRNIDLAKNIWFLENKKMTNDVPTWDDINSLLAHDQPYYQFDPTNHLPICPSGGVYTIGQVGDKPACSLGTNIIPAHVLY